jgi:hypothetical protein
VTRVSANGFKEGVVGAANGFDDDNAVFGGDGANGFDGATSDAEVGGGGGAKGFNEATSDVGGGAKGFDGATSDFEGGAKGLDRMAGFGSADAAATAPAKGFSAPGAISDAQTAVDAERVTSSGGSDNVGRGGSTGINRVPTSSVSFPFARLA